MNNSLGIQGVHGVLKALLAVIMAVVVGCVYRFHRTAGVNSCKRCRGFECEGFILAAAAVCEGSFIVGDSQVICFKNTLYIL